MPCRMSLDHCSMAPTLRATCCTISQPSRQLSIARFRKSSMDDTVVEQAVPIDERTASLGRIVTRPSGGSRMASVNPLLEPLVPHTSHDDDETDVDSGASGFKWLSPATRGMLLLNLGAALFGSNQVIIKASEELMSPYALNALRFSAAALCFLPLIPRSVKSVPLAPAMELGCWLTLGYTFQAIGLSMTSASHGAFTGAFTVLTVPVLIGLSGKHVGRSVWFSAAAALFGISLLTGDGGQPNLGDLACVVSAVLFGIHTWRVEAIVCSVNDAKALVTLQLAVLALCSIALAAPELVETVGTNGVSGTLELSKGLPWGDVLFMGVGTTALTLWIEMESLKDVSSATAALIYTSEPIWGAMFAWVMLSERWGMQGWAGAALVVGASVYSQMSGDSEKLKIEADSEISVLQKQER